MTPGGGLSRSGFTLGLLLTLGSTGLLSQQDPPSHRERFASRTDRLQRDEREASLRLSANPNDTNALNARALARLGLGRTEEALDDLRRAAELESGSADPRASLAYGLWVQGRLHEAKAAAESALALNADHAGAHYYLGSVLLKLGDVQQSMWHLERATELNPDDPEMRFDLLNAYREAGDTIKASSQLRILRGALSPRDPRIAYAEGLLSADLGNLDVAVGRFREALAANPKLDAARLDLGVALVKTGRQQEAIETLGQVAKTQPQSFAAAYFRALALQNSQRASEAEAEARRALALRPDSADAQALLGIILAGRGAHAEALEALTRAAQLDPKNFDAQFYLGRARYALRDLPGSRDAFRAALAIRPDDVEARFFLATVLEAAGEKDPAIAEYRELVSRRPQDARGYIGLGAVLAKYGEVEPALEQLRRAREIAPQDFEAALALGRLLVKEGRVGEGIKSLEESVALAPSSPEAHYQLGLALRRAGRAAEAQREFATVEQLNRQRRSASGGMGSPEEKQ